MTNTPEPRLLMIMGSGETSPTMVTPHQRVFARLGSEVAAVLLDTPFGFQENADELTARIQTYFRESVGRSVGVASLRSRRTDLEDPAATARALNALTQARWIFSGPGSPSYALAQWYDSAVVAVLDERLRSGGAVVFASAASLTLGAFTVPVYEIYKVGAEPVWLEGLDVLGRATGLRAAVIPHFDNAEGGTHDTRYCYLGEKRLVTLEEQLPDDAFVLGIDEHTGLVIDVESGNVEIVGRGFVTVRKTGVSTQFSAGDQLTVSRIAELAGSSSQSVAVTPEVEDDNEADGITAHQVRELLESGDVESAVTALLDLHASSLGAADEAAVAALIADLGDRAANAPVDQTSIVGPYLDLILELRSAARSEKRFSESDLIRDRLAAAGVEIRDTPTGPEWNFT